MRKVKTTKAELKQVKGQLLGAMADVDFLKRSLHNTMIMLGHDLIDVDGIYDCFDAIQQQSTVLWLKIDWLLRRIRAERPK